MGILGSTVGGWLDSSPRADNEYSDVNKGNFNLPHAKSQYDYYGRFVGSHGDRKAPRIGDSAFDDYQGSLARILFKDMKGVGPTQQLARMQAQEAADRAAQQQLAFASSARPGMSGLSYQNAAMNAANAQSAVGGQAAMAGLQGQLAAYDRLNQVAGTARGQDIQRSMANQDATLRMLGLNDQAQLEALRQRLMLTQAQQQGRMAYEQNQTQRYGAAMGAPTRREGLMGAIVGVGGGLMGAAGGGGGAGVQTFPGANNPSSGAGYYPQSF